MRRTKFEGIKRQISDFWTVVTRSESRKVYVILIRDNSNARPLDFKICIINYQRKSESIRRTLMVWTEVWKEDGISLY